MAKTTSFQEFFTKFAPVTKRLQLDPYFKDQTTSLGVYFEPIKKKKFEKIFLVNAFANGLISVLLMVRVSINGCFDSDSNRHQNQNKIKSKRHSNRETS